MERGKPITAEGFPFRTDSSTWVPLALFVSPSPMVGTRQNCKRGCSSSNWGGRWGRGQQPRGVAAVKCLLSGENTTASTEPECSSSVCSNAPHFIPSYSPYLLFRPSRRSSYLYNIPISFHRTCLGSGHSACIQVIAQIIIAQKTSRPVRFRFTLKFGV